jgi:hypothetical protein
MKNLKIAEITIKTPDYPRYKDPNNKILIVKFDSGEEWVPSFAELRALDKAVEACYTFNRVCDHRGTTGEVPIKIKEEDKSGSEEREEPGLP